MTSAATSPSPTPSSPSSPSSSTQQSNKRRNKGTSPEERSIPFNCSMPYSEFLRLQDEAEKLGVSRSELLRRALQLYYRQEEQY